MNISHEEVRSLEKKIRTSIGDEISMPADLKRLLARGLAKFEESLNALPAEQRERAVRLYLDRMRSVTFELHMAVLRAGTKNDMIPDGVVDRTAVRARLERHETDIQQIAELYELL